MFKKVMLFLYIMVSFDYLYAAVPEEYTQQIKENYTDKINVPDIDLKYDDELIRVSLYTFKDENDTNFMDPQIKNQNDYPIFDYFSWRGGYGYIEEGLSFDTGICVNKTKDIFVSILTKNIFLYKNKTIIQYNIFLIPRKHDIKSFDDLENQEIDTPEYETYLYTDDQQITEIPYNPKHLYPYYNEKRVLDRLYEKGVCDKKATEQADIQIKHNGVWISQQDYISSLS